MNLEGRNNNKDKLKQAGGKFLTEPDETALNMNFAERVIICHFSNPETPRIRVYFLGRWKI